MTGPAPRVPLRHALRRGRSPVVWLSALLVVVLLGWAGWAWLDRALEPAGCQVRTVVDVVAAPAVADAVGRAAAARPATGCVKVQVSPRDSAGFADDLANPPSGARPHVWIPESTYWLQRAQSLGAFEVPATGTSIATSPVVLAMSDQVAAEQGWPDRPVSWGALLRGRSSDVPVGLPDPATDPVGVAALVAVQAIVADDDDPAAAQSAVLRRFTEQTVTRAADLYRRLPEAGSGARTLGAFVTSEQAMLRHAQRPGASPLVAAYPPADVPTLDFPYVVLPGTADETLSAATAFLGELLAPAGRRTLDAAGFRGVDGTASGLAQESAGRAGTAAVPPVPMPADATLVQLLSAWTGVQLSSRMLGVIDVSGSMAEQVPGGGSRLGLTIDAAQQGLGLLLDTTEVGIWLFSTNLDGDRDYRVLARARPLGESRDELRRRLDQVRVKPDGDTGLYDTTLAAYREARRTWAPGRINVLLIATDGKNDDASSISRAQLLAELRELADPRRPLPIVFMGIGGDIDPDELDDIASVTDGRVFQAKKASDIRDIFFTALSDFSCQPPSCRK